MHNESPQAAADAILDARQLLSIITVEDFENEMQKRVTHHAFEYVSGGAGAGLTLLENRAAFNRLRILPRALVDATHIDTKIELFGRIHDFPILLAPAGYNMLMHPRGELEAIEGANLADATMCAANFSNFTVEEIGAVAQRPLWFQLYVQTDRGFTKEMVERAVAAGCEAICVTVDVPVNGPRDRELRAGFRLPPGVQRANLRGLGEAISAAAHRPAGRNIYSATHGADATWKDVDLAALDRACQVTAEGSSTPGRRSPRGQCRMRRNHRFEPRRQKPRHGSGHN